jgi:hypothetical protein
LSPLRFINNASSADTPMIRGYLSRLRILFPVIVADAIIFALVISFDATFPNM